MIDPELVNIGITIAATFITTVITMGKWFHLSLARLNSRINDLSLAISALDKNLAVQTALFEQFLKKGFL